MWTAEQLRAINEDGNLLVSAAAGAGKTAVITERIARIIASGTDVSEILVVTFTNPAAAEMKQRIERRLSELAESTDDTKLKMHLHDSAINISTANISTIHSFCGNVLRRNCHIVGLDPALPQRLHCCALKHWMMYWKRHIRMRKKLRIRIFACFVTPYSR